MDENKNNALRQGVSYVLYGVLTSFVNLATFYLFKKSGFTATALGYTIANGVAWMLAVIFAFITNKLFVFNSKSWKKEVVVGEAVKFLAGRLFSGVFEILLPTPVALWAKGGVTISFGNGIYHLDNQWVAKILVSILVIIMNFVISKFFVFKAKTNLDKNSFDDDDDNDLIKMKK